MLCYQVRLGSIPTPKSSRGLRVHASICLLSSLMVYWEKSFWETTMLQCNQCHIEYPLSEFKNGQAANPLLRNACKMCADNILSQIAAENEKGGLQLSRGWTEQSQALLAEQRKIRVSGITPSRKVSGQTSAESNRQQYLRRKHAGDYTDREWHDVLRAYNYICPRCGVEMFYRGNRTRPTGFTPDHVLPISKGGTNTINNIQPLCYTCNCFKKQARETIRYLPWSGPHIVYTTVHAS